MPQYSYRSITFDGKRQGGIITATSLSDAKERLRAQGILITQLEEQLKKRRGKSKHSLSKQALVNFSGQLAQLLGARVPLYESLLSLADQYQQEPFHPLLLNLCEQVKEGTPFSQALEHYPDSFPILYTAMVAAGESVGALDKALEKLATLLSKHMKLRKQLTTSLLYPLLLGSFSLLIIFLMMVFVIPSIEALFADRDVNRFTRLVIGTSHFLTQKWMIYLPLTGALSLFGTLWFKSHKGRLFFHRMLLRLPLIKTVITQAAMARFSRTMGTLLEGGVSIINALQIARKVMRNPFLEEVIAHSEERIVEGSLLSAELKKSPLIPPLVSRMLAIGEESGSAPTMHHKIADLYEEEVEKTLNRLTALMQPVILLIMGGIVGLIMMAILLPLSDVSGWIQP